MNKSKERSGGRVSAWAWVPTLYVAEGLPYIAVNTLSVIMYKNMGMSNADVALFTGWLYLPWVIKPFWSPFVDILKTKRWWTVWMQFLIGSAFALLAFMLPVDGTVALSLAVFWLVGFASATHDIAADGYYMLALDSSQQSMFVGIRSAFYRLATIVGQGGVVMAAGYLETTLGNVPLAWSITFAVLAAFFVCVAFYHSKVLPRPLSDVSVGTIGEKVPESSGQATEKSGSGNMIVHEPSGQSSETVLPVADERRNNGFGSVMREFAGTFGSFFRKKDVLVAMAFILLYRFPEAQLVKIINPFLLDPVSEGGLGLSTSQIGFVYGTIGIVGLTLGGILGGILVSRFGLKRCLWPMALCLTLPCAVFCWMSMVQPDYALLWNKILVNACVFVEQFGYGVGFTSFMLYMMYFAQGPNRTSHYAICTAFMALGMMLPGMFAGILQETMGYVGFFWWIMGCCLVTLAVTALIKVDAEYGKKDTIVH